MDATKAKKHIAKQLLKLAELADEHGIELDNGGLLGSILGSVASDLGCQVEREKRNDRAA